MKHSSYKTLLCVVFLLISLTGCNKSKEEDEKIFVMPSFRLGIQQGEGTIECKAAHLFAQKVDALSQGTISIKVFPGGKLGDDISMIQSVMDGTLDLTYTETGRLGLWVREAEIFGYPFAFDDFDHMKRIIDGEYGQYLHKRFNELNIKVLATGYNGTRQTTSNKEINSITDMKDLRFRVPDAYANKRFVECCGAKPCIVPFHEVYRQLKTDLIEAQENPLPTIYSNHFYEVQTSIALTNHIINDCNIIINTESFNRLNDWQKDAIQQAAIMAADFLSDSFQKEETYLLNFFESQGLTITKPNISSFRKACIPIYEDYIFINGDRGYKAIISGQEKE